MNKNTKLVTLFSMDFSNLFVSDSIVMWSPIFTADASKRIEKCFLDLRNIFLNQENIIKFFSK